jgi:hypothetical protein
VFTRPVMTPNQHPFSSSFESVTSTTGPSVVRERGVYTPIGQPMNAGPNVSGGMHAASASVARTLGLGELVGWQTLG